MANKNNKFRNLPPILTFLAFLLVFIFAPRMDGPRVIAGIEFTTKAGQPGLTNLGWILLLTVPPATYLLSRLVVRQFAKKAKSNSEHGKS